jgi:hypothetical protein
MTMHPRYSVSTPAPTWEATPYHLLDAARKANCRINQFRLTQQEADELRAYTGRDDQLLGYPVKIKHTTA